MLFVLFSLIAFALVAILVVVTTIGVTVASLATLLTAPGQLRALLRDRRLRRNHALEHATINVIEERHGPTRLAGKASAEGFTIRGGASPDLVASAAQEAWVRLKAGERELAIHPRCGTTLISAQLVLGVTFLVTLILLRELSWLPFLAGLVAAVVLGPRLSPFLQRHVTTDADPGDLRITGVSMQAPSGRLGLVSMLVLGPVLVRTGETVAEGPPGTGRVERGRATVVVVGDEVELPSGSYRVR